MNSSNARPIDPALGAWGWAALALAWVTGVALQLRQPVLWPGACYPLLLAAGLGLAWAALRLRRSGFFRMVAPMASVAVVALGFAFAGWRADVRLSDALAPEWEGCDVEVVGVIDEMPQIAEDGEHFAFTIESARPLSMKAQQVRRLLGLAAAAGSARPAVAEVSMQARASSRTADPGDGVEAGAADRTVAPSVDSSPGLGMPIVPSRVWLAWSRNQRDDRAVAATPAPLHAGQRWRLPVRLRLPHGAMNPDGFDAELWLFDQNLRATGVVQGNGDLLDTQWAPIENARQWIRDRLLLSGADSPADAQASGALAALAVGDQAAVDTAGWEVFRNTGVAHLMSISGLHITMLGWLGGRAIGALWRRSERASLAWPTPLAARWGGVLVAWLYALLAGWGVPAQRTVLMLAATAALRSRGLNWPPTLLAVAAMVPVTCLDPWALLQPGFWLSFAAVGLLMVSEPARAGAAHDADASADRVNSARPPDGQGVPDSSSVPRHAGTATAAAAPTPSPGSDAPLRRAAAVFAAVAARAARALAGELRGGFRAQVVASIGLAPLTLVAFQQVSLVGLAANLVAEPWITLVVTPLTLLGVALPPLWHLAALALQPLLWLLAWLARWPLASVHVATPSLWGLVCGLVGGAVLMLPIPWCARLLGLPMLLPLLAPYVDRPVSGRFELVAVDVGQGTAVLVRTHAHLLLFDTGPRFGDDNDAGLRMLLPLLQARGERRVDTLVLSHADADHVGGAQSIIDRLPVAALRSSLDARNPLRANPLPHTPCAAGQSWDWDGVEFHMLHPFPRDYRPGVKTNAVSCVLRVVDAQGRSALLTGDVEAAQEADLVAASSAAASGAAGPSGATALADERAARLASDVLVVPHHGSHTSSTDAFLDAVHPQVAVIQVGYRSRYGHPAPEVVARYRAHGIAVVRTDHCGAWTWRDDDAVCTRAVRRRYWAWQGTPELLTPARITVSSTGNDAGSDVAIESRDASRGAASRKLEGAQARHEFVLR